MTAKPDTYSLTLELLRSNQYVLYFDVSAVALYVWDYFLTFDLEFDLVWKSEWTLTKCLFLVQRYMPFIDSVGLIPYQNFGRDITIIQCHQAFRILGWMMVAGTLLSELLLALRVWAVWHRERWLAVVLLLSVVTLWSPAFFYMNQFLKSLQFGSRPYPGHFGCFVLDAPDALFISFVCIMTWNLGTLILIVVPGFKAYQGGENLSLFYVVYRDGVTYYLYLLVLSFLNVVAIKTFPVGTNYVFLSLQRCLHTILASRVLLHIRHHIRFEKELLSQAAHEPESDIIPSIQCSDQEAACSA